MNKAYATLAAALMLSASAFQANACTTDTPVSLFGAGGSNGLLATDGNVPANLGDVLTNGSSVSQIYNGGDYENGVAHFNGSADCSALRREMEEATFNTAALAAALSTPVWLEADERFAISGGLGFSDGATALGATGIIRFDKNWSGFAGGAFSTDDSDLWAAKAGLRLGW